VRLHQLVHATRVLQRLVDLGVAVLVELVGPGGAVVVALLVVVAGEQAIVELEVLTDDERRVGVRLHVVHVDLVVVDEVVDDAAQEGDVAAHADRRVVVGDRSRAREARVDHDELRLAMLDRLGHPLEAAGVRFGGIAAHDQDKIGVLDVHPMVGHRTAPKRRGQTGHRRGVSDTRLGIE
jgi:hypothetical protein